MSLLLVGLSQSSTSVAVLERAVVPREEVAGVLAQVAGLPDVDGAVLLSTCNRVEVLLDVPRFHAVVDGVVGLLADRAGLGPVDLAEALEVHWEDAAVEHLFRVSAGLDSMVVGEPQVLGQLRDAYATATAAGTGTPALHQAVQAALRVGKRVRAEAGLDKAGADLVAVGLDAAQEAVGGLGGRRALVVGAGSLGALAGAWLRRRGVAEVVVANRSPARGARLAEALEGRAVGLDALGAELRRADVVVTATGSTGTVLSAQDLADAVADRPAATPLAVLDLALPRDVDPTARWLPGLVLVDLETLQTTLAPPGGGGAVAASGEMVAQEVSAWVAARSGTRVTPTVVALRAKAAAVVEAELARLDARVPDLPPAARAELAATLRRTVATLLHTPSVRVKELAAGPGGDAYATALAELFELGSPAAPR